MSQMNLGNVEIYYELHGDPNKKPLVLVSGYIADHSYWLPAIDALTKEFYVLIFDNRATGQSIEVDESVNLDMETMADDVIALIDALSIKKPGVIGQSMGGAIVQVIASKYAEKISSACIVNSPLKWRANVVAGLTGLHYSCKENASFECLFQANLAWVFGESFISDIKKVSQLRVLIESNKYPQSVSNQARQLSALKSFDGQNFVNQISVPVLVICGEEDIICPPSDALALANKITGAKYIELKGTAHSPLLEVLEVFLSEVIKFLKSNSLGGL